MGKGARKSKKGKIVDLCGCFHCMKIYPGYPDAPVRSVERAQWKKEAETEMSAEDGSTN